MPGGRGPARTTSTTTALAAEELLRRLVRRLKREGSVRSPEVESALERAPRHLFLPGVQLEQVYSDEAVITKRNEGVGVSSASQPTVVATMLEQLQLRPGLRVLEIGAGTGYNAALMASLVGEGGEVITLDIDEDIVEAARRNLADAGFDRVRVVCGDGAYGLPDGAPYDRIVLTVGSWDIAPAWVTQLRPDGLLLIPLWLRGAQKTIAFRKRADRLDSVSVSDCAFMPLRGALAVPQWVLSLGTASRLLLTAEGPLEAAPGTILGWLSGPHSEKRTGVRVRAEEVWRGLLLWLGLRHPGFCSIAAAGEAEGDIELPWLFRWPGLRATAGVVGAEGAAVIARGGRARAFERREFALSVRAYGKAEEAARRLVEDIRAWDREGRAGSESLKIRAYDADVEYSAIGDEFTLPRPNALLVVSGPGTSA